MKVFLCCGSIKEETSSTKFITERFIFHLKEHCTESIEVFHADLLKYNIDYCDGTITPFITGETQTQDDMVILEKELLLSDLIIIASPVYGNNVSGSIKTFLDRISHWTHLFRLLGKYGSAFAISSNSGSEFTLNYLNQIMEGLGLSMVNRQNFITNLSSRETMDDMLKIQAKLAIEKIKSGIFTFSNEQEFNFMRYKQMYGAGNGFENEIKYWKSSGMLEVDTLNEYLKQIKMQE